MSELIGFVAVGFLVLVVFLGLMTILAILFK